VSSFAGSEYSFGGPDMPTEKPRERTERRLRALEAHIQELAQRCNQLHDTVKNHEEEMRDTRHG
jgi:septal ring factor EnvC (AmiA/AmiB activator)